MSIDNEFGTPFGELTGDPNVDIRLLANEMKHMRIKQGDDEIELKKLKEETVPALEREILDVKKKLFAGKWTIVGIIFAVGSGSVVFWEKLLAVLK